MYYGQRQKTLIDHCPDCGASIYEDEEGGIIFTGDPVFCCCRRSIDEDEEGKQIGE